MESPKIELMVLETEGQPNSDPVMYLNGVAVQVHDVRYVRHSPAVEDAAASLLSTHKVFRPSTPVVELTIRLKPEATLTRGPNSTPWRRR